MSRMRLMEAGGARAGALVCMHCGAEKASRPPYAVVYCDCRSRPVAAPRPVRMAA
jgi:hypothetical protein